MVNPGPLVFFYDYTDAASFLLEHRLRSLGWVPGDGLHPLPFENNPPPNSLPDPRMRDWREEWDRMEREARGHRVTLQCPRIVPWTRKAHELALEAAEEGRGAEIHEKVFRAYLIEGLDIGRVDVLAGLAASCGLDPSRVKVALDVDKQKDAVETIRRGAIQQGVIRSPALLLGGRLLQGYPSPEALSSFLGGVAPGEQP